VARSQVRGGNDDRRKSGARLGNPVLVESTRSLNPVMEELFAPPAYEWMRLSEKYRSMQMLTNLIVPPILFTIPAVIVGVASGKWWISALIWAAAVVIVIIRLAFVTRSWRSWGYVEREDDLYITHGVMFRSLIAVPYGRMQLVEVESGPLERGFGLASVTLKTASPETGARIPGLTPEEATRLRDRLIQLGEAHASGL
jgi:uncharacterized protein